MSKIYIKIFATNLSPPGVGRCGRQRERALEHARPSPAQAAVRPPRGVEGGEVEGGGRGGAGRGGRGQQGRVLGQDVVLAEQRVRALVPALLLLRQLLRNTRVVTVSCPGEPRALTTLTPRGSRRSGGGTWGTWPAITGGTEQLPARTERSCRVTGGRREPRRCSLAKYSALFSESETVKLDNERRADTSSTAALSAQHHCSPPPRV